jgi:hypothetical protein
MLMSGGFRDHSEGCPKDPSLRRVRGCDEKAPIAVFELDGERHYRCPYFYLTDEIWEFLSFYGHYKQGFLPDAGGIGDQSWTFITACSVLTGQLAKLEERKSGVAEET